MVKKIIIAIIAVAVLVVASVWGFLYYQRAQSFKVVVPAAAVNAVRINVEQIGIDLLLSGGPDTADEKKGGKKRKYGLELPLNVFLFGFKDMPSTFLLSRWAISDYVDFKVFIKEEFNYTGGVYVHNSKLFSCLYNDKTAVMMTSTKPDAAMLAAANEYLSGSNTVAFSESKWIDLKQAGTDITVAGSWGEGSLDFEKGSVDARWTSDVPARSLPAIAPVPEDMAFALHASSNLADDLYSLFSRRTDSMHWDRLRTAFASGYALYIKGAVSQQEAVVTYDFDDNFEKVARTSIQEKSVPGVYLRVPMGKDALSVLPQESILLPPDSVSKSLFPLFALRYKIDSSGVVAISSNMEQILYQPDQKAVPEPGRCLSLYCNVAQLRELPLFADAAAYLKPFEKLKLQGIQKDGKILYTLNLSFMNRQQYALKQVLDLF